MNANKNIFLLIVALGVGQGSLFLAHTWLIVNDASDFIGIYGILFTFLVLFQTVVDWGGIVLLAGEEVSEPDPERLNATFWGLVLTRFVIACTISIGLILFTFTSFPPFFLIYSIAASPGLILFSINVGGMLDGRRKSGMNGLSAAAPYICTALILPLAQMEELPIAGLELGLAFSFGIIMQVTGQFLLLYRNGQKLGKPVICPSAVSRIAKNGAFYLATWLPTQLLYRSQITFGAMFFGTAELGLLIFVKQIVNVGLQFLHFIRRSRFPELVEFIKAEHSLREALCFQNKSAVVALAGSICLCLVGVAPFLLNLTDFKQAGFLMIAFSPLMLVSNLYASINQVAFAKNLFRRSSLVALVTLASGIILNFFAARYGDIFTLALVESILVIGAAGLVWRLMCADWVILHASPKAAA